MSVFHQIAALFKRRPRPLVAGGEGALASMQIQETMATLLLEDLLRDRRNERRWKWFRRIVISGAGTVLFAFYLILQAQHFGIRWVPKNELVGIVRLHGGISSDSDASAAKVVPLLRKAFEKDNVKAIVLSIDSPGGQPAEAERIAEAISALKIKHPKPITAVISNTGASAAYLVALRADKIVAGHYSLVGSIGAIIHGWDAHKLLENYDVSQRVFASGKHKNMLNPYTPMSAETAAKAQTLVDALGSKFASEVRQYRKGKVAVDADIATGEVWTGDAALTIGLIDEVATLDNVVNSAGEFKSYDFGPMREPSLFAMPQMAANWFAALRQSLSDAPMTVR